MKTDRSEMTAHAGLKAARHTTCAYRAAPKSWSLPASKVVEYAIATVWGAVVYNVASAVLAVLS